VGCLHDAGDQGLHVLRAHALGGVPPWLQVRRLAGLGLFMFAVLHRGGGVDDREVGVVGDLKLSLVEQPQMKFAF